ncbi:enoyl-CoA hydratase/isomerase family protein [Pseudonocardia sp.]|uniref:enoyl-CoA hydratase/isomerase family protein n=1 Tax=Pseudonocardia sp. TaxID=60912 RepID=UPI00261FA720|nr:enoyl-CoA hydratase/isomerase family protein [Pseudonocardia sp.]MCW2716745.1 enoyl-CoA hydratase [Pseudonocardia sp.]
MWHDDFPDLLFDQRADGVLVIVINRPDTLNATDEVLHRQLADVWREVSRDPAVRVAVITGAGSAFSAGGDLRMIEEAVGDFAGSAMLMREARDLVQGLVDCEKPIISAINGVAVGAGLVVGLMADISIIAEDARFTDGHLRLGVAAGDHAAMLWPLLCSLAKARYYLLTSEFIDGREAERIGLVSKCVPAETLMDEALRVATKLADGPQMALRWTKRALNGWLELGAPIFEASLGFEMLSFMGEDAAEGVRALREKRRPDFRSNEGRAASLEIPTPGSTRR